MENNLLILIQTELWFREELSMDWNIDTEVPWEFQNKGVS